jgi:hypothetical protein
VGIEEGGRLPPENPEGAAAAPLGRREHRVLCLGLGDAGGGEHLRGQGRGEPEADHHLHEGPAAQAPAAHVLDQVAKLSLVHVLSPAP